MPSTPPPNESNSSDVAASLKRGDIYYVDLDPVVGSEQGGRRPTLIIQNDVGNAYSPVLIVAAIMLRHTRTPRPTDVTITPGSSGLQVPSRLLLNQIRTIDRRRLDRYVGWLSPEELARVDDVIKNQPRFSSTIACFKAHSLASLISGSITY